MTKHKSFEQLYNLLIQFIKINNKIPSSSSNDKLEKRLGNWCYQLRKNYRQNNIHPNKIKLLENINIWFWNKQEFNKNKCFKEINQLNFSKQLLSNKSKNWIKNNNLTIDNTIKITNNEIVISL